MVLMVGFTRRPPFVSPRPRSWPRRRPSGGWPRRRTMIRSLDPPYPVRDAVHLIRVRGPLLLDAGRVDAEVGVLAQHGEDVLEAVLDLRQRGDLLPEVVDGLDDLLPCVLAVVGALLPLIIPRFRDLAVRVFLLVSIGPADPVRVR